MVIWITGLSGSGKTTIANALCNHFENAGSNYEHLDGDKLRQIFPRTGFSKDERNAHIRRTGYLASMLERHGVTVVASFISPYEESRRFVRQQCNDFFEVHLSTPLETCESRDPKGLYKKARSGEIENFTGVSDPYEIPENPELRIDTSQSSVEDAVKQILDIIQQ